MPIIRVNARVKWNRLANPQAVATAQRLLEGENQTMRVVMSCNIYPHLIANCSFRSASFSSGGGRIELSTAKLGRVDLAIDDQPTCLLSVLDGALEGQGLLIEIVEPLLEHSQLHVGVADDLFPPPDAPR
jgi:hypothetical protein